MEQVIGAVPQGIPSNNSTVGTINYRSTDERIFVNKPLDFHRIRAVGFDMDYTIAPYNDEYEKLQFDLAVQNLVSVFKYPAAILKFEYDKSFAVKGLFLDTELGNILKIDQFGYIHVALHGKQKLSEAHVKRCYKDKTIPVTTLEKNERYYLQSSAFAAPLITLYAWLIEYFEDRQALVDPLNAAHKTRLHYDTLDDINTAQLCYFNLFADVDKALGMVHGAKAQLKQITQKNPEKYIIKSESLPKMLLDLKNSGKITFLLTNSGYEYTNAVLRFLLGENYPSYFTYIVVDAKKPNFFTDSTAFREVILPEGNLSFTSIGQKLLPNKIYANGNQRDFTRILNIRTKEMLYCGDHITGDTGATKNQLQRTLYICPEIKKEIQILTDNHAMYEQLSKLEKERNEFQQRCCNDPDMRLLNEKPAELTEIQAQIDKLTKEIDAQFNANFGSIFTTTWGKTWLSQYLQENSDLYTGELINLQNYPAFYVFMQNYNAELPHMEAAYKMLPTIGSKPLAIKIMGSMDKRTELVPSTVEISLKDFVKSMRHDEEETTGYMDDIAGETALNLE